MTIVGIDHIQLAMPAGREDEARAFYARLLGIPEIAKPPELAKRGGAWFESGAVKVHLGVEPDFRPARKAHPRCSSGTFAASSCASARPGSTSSTTSPCPATTASSPPTRSATGSSCWSRFASLEPIR